MRKPDVDSKAIQSVLVRAFGRTPLPQVDRTEEGVSTQVYRVQRGEETFYLRVSEEETDSLGPEVQVHSALRAAGVRVPEVIFFEPFDEELRRSVMVTAQIEGSPLRRDASRESVRDVLTEAGRDLARINQVPVAGFGWLLRNAHSGALRGEFSSYAAWALDGLEDLLRLLSGDALSSSEARRAERLVAEAVADPGTAPARLAHGDFDTTQIFQRAGRYTGVIDFGESRGAEPWYDLAHFALHDGERVEIRGSGYLQAGYAELAPLPDDIGERLRRTAVRIGLFRLGRQLDRRGPDAAGNAYTTWLGDRVRDLLR